MGTLCSGKKTYQMVGLPPSSASMIHFGTGYQSKIDDKWIQMIENHRIRCRDPFTSLPKGSSSLNYDYILKFRKRSTLDTTCHNQMWDILKVVPALQQPWPLKPASIDGQERLVRHAGYLDFGQHIKIQHVLHVFDGFSFSQSCKEPRFGAWASDRAFILTPLNEHTHLQVKGPKG